MPAEVYQELHTEGQHEIVRLHGKKGSVCRNEVEIGIVVLNRIITGYKLEHVHNVDGNALILSGNATG